MRTIANRLRTERLMQEAISDFDLDLRGIGVLTEAASGPFAITPILAAMAGSEHVVALGRNSIHGPFEMIKSYIGEWATCIGLPNRLLLHDDREMAPIEDCSLVTNLGFVRPIDRPLLHRLPGDAAIALMWEPWEFRIEDLDLDACRQLDVPVAGTDECHPRVATFEYLGPLALRLLMEAEIEIHRSTTVLVSSEPFMSPIRRALENLGGHVVALSPDEAVEAARDQRTSLPKADGLIVAEHRDRRCLVGEAEGIPVSWLAASATPLIHISGNVATAEIARMGIVKVPPQEAPFGHMAATTDALGPRPVIDLHAAGLRVGETLVRSRRTGASVHEAVKIAVQGGLALPMT